MKNTSPVPMRFEKDIGFFPENQYWLNICNYRFGDGEVVTLDEVNDRSQKSHDQLFPLLREAFSQLPEEFKEQFPTAEHLRARALIEAGYFDETVVDAGFPDTAREFAATIRGRSTFSLVVIKDNFVIIRDPRSQSLRSMKKKEFQESKTKVLEIVCDMIGITVEELMSNTGKAA